MENKTVKKHGGERRLMAVFVTNRGLKWRRKCYPRTVMERQSIGWRIDWEEEAWGARLNLNSTKECRLKDAKSDTGKNCKASRNHPFPTGKQHFLTDRTRRTIFIHVVKQWKIVVSKSKLSKSSRRELQYINCQYINNPWYLHLYYCEI